MNKSLFIGLGIGLFVAIVVYIWQWTKINKTKKASKEEIKRYKDMLADRMDIESEGLNKLKIELEKLRQENENLRVTNSALAQKPGRAEVQRLQVYQDAIEKLMISSPGFGSAWHTCLKEAENDLEQTKSGFLPFIRKAIPQRSTSLPKIEVIDDKREK